MRMHHLGVATHDAQQTAGLLGELLGATQCHSEQFDGLDIRFLRIENGFVELLEPIENGTVARFLERRGPGIHHIGLEPEDIDVALAQAADLGIERIDESPRPGAWGHDVAFLHPGDTGGVLIEFVAERSK